ncbi:RCC1 and BTB domain-containing protein 1-like [Cloeon dipterum]|uniref:RCC1 and BTB domain-containing protein 1-like n=1 Tax=Cloeon dipterum TaxID=197152 RepID=UPI003220968F
MFSDSWKILASLSDQVKSSIRLAIVFNGGGSAIFATKDDEVFGLGQNDFWCLGTGEDSSPGLGEPQRINALCGQKIEGLEYSQRFSVFAISDSGSVFAWGANGCGQLGLGTNRQTNIPTKITGKLEEQTVVQVACGEIHTLALTSDGQVFAFGYNSYGQLGLGVEGNFLMSSLFPRKVEGLLAGSFVTAIACRRNGSLALLKTGEVFIWGAQIDDTFITFPLQVLGLEGVPISRISCGSNHFLALSNDRKIYAWGNNCSGQLGIESADEPKATAEIIPASLGRVKEIAAFANSSAALTESNQVYVWGQYNGQNITSPTVTSHSSFDNVFAPDTFRPLRPKEDYSEELKMKDTLDECLKRAFNNPDISDFTFIVEENKIHVHKCILMLRCAVFKTMFQGDWKESKASEQKIEGHSFAAFNAFLKYFYTDKLDVHPNLALG